MNSTEVLDLDHLPRLLVTHHRAAAEKVLAWLSARPAPGDDSDAAIVVHGAYGAWAAAGPDTGSKIRAVRRSYPGKKPALADDSDGTRRVASTGPDVGRPGCIQRVATRVVAAGPDLGPVGKGTNGGGTRFHYQPMA